MKQPKKLADRDFPDIGYVPDGYDMIGVAEMTRENFNVLIEEHNNLVDVVNILCEKRGIVFDGDKP